jgi:serine/threonine-protein kinase
MGVTTFVIMQRQQAEMMRQVSGYGATLARFLAAQNAAAALGEDWPAIEVAVQEIMRTRDFEGLAVVDATGVVRASSVPSQVGQRYKAAGTESLGSNGRVAISRYMAGGESIIGFETPMTFQDRDVGRVALGVAERPLTQMARLAAAMMGVLALVTVLAVAVAMYFLVNWFEKPIRLVGDALGEIAKGRFDHRIGEKRSDEFGQLYTSFDAMAAALQRRDAGGGGAEPSTLGPPRTPPGGTA